MPKYNVVVKDTHYWMHEVEAHNKEHAISRLRDEKSTGVAVNVDEYFGDWQEMAEGEIISVSEVEVAS